MRRRSVADTSDERLRYLIGRLAAHADTATFSVDGGRIEELCHLILRELRPTAAFTAEDIANEAVRAFEQQGSILARPIVRWNP